MKSRAQLLFGSVLILFGFMLLAGNLFDIDFGDFCLPVFFILIGVLILVRPQMLPSGTGFKPILLGDLRRVGEWEVKPEEVWIFLGTLFLDLSTANLPDGETTYRVFSFIGDLRVSLPEGIGVSVSNMAFISDDRYLGQKRGGLFTPVEWSSERYEAAEKKLRIERISFLGSVKVRRPKESQK